MRRTVFCAALFLAVCGFIALPLSAQECRSCLIVETLPPTPTIVKTGEPFIVDYWVNYLELPNSGKEIVVLADQMGEGIFSPFEVMRLDASVKQRVGDVHRWRFRYVLRIVDPEKGDFKIPRITFFWVVRGTGAASSSEEQNLMVREFKTEEIPITYATTITKDGPYAIRDAMHFGDFGRRARILKIVSGALVLIFLVWFVWQVRRFLRGTWRVQGAREATQEASPGATIELSDAAFRRELRALRKLALNPVYANQENHEKCGEIERKIFRLIRALLILEVPKAQASHTPRELVGCVEAGAKGKRKEILTALAVDLVRYEANIDSGKHASLENLASAVRRLRSAYWNLWFRRWFA